MQADNGIAVEHVSADLKADIGIAVEHLSADLESDSGPAVEHLSVDLKAGSELALVQPSADLKADRGIEVEHPSVDLEADSLTSAMSEVNENRWQLEELQIQTIFSLVEQVKIEVDANTSSKSILFLSNKQARAFDFSDMGKILSAMDIQWPKLVINLVPSFVGASKTSD